jgi:hypothetical protein
MGKATLSSWFLQSKENEVFSMRKRGQHDALVFSIEELQTGLYGRQFDMDSTLTRVLDLP